MLLFYYALFLLQKYDLDKKFHLILVSLNYGFFGKNMPIINLWDRQVE